MALSMFLFWCALRKSKHKQNTHFSATLTCFYPLRLQIRPVDLTRAISDAAKSNTEKDTTRKLAFSVENILDPNKFCGKKDTFNPHWMNGFDRRDDREHMDDDRSESESGKAIILIS